MKQLENSCSIQKSAAWLTDCTAVYLKMWPQQMTVSVWVQPTNLVFWASLNDRTSVMNLCWQKKKNTNVCFVCTRTNT